MNGGRQRLNQLKVSLRKGLSLGLLAIVLLSCSFLVMAYGVIDNPPVLWTTDAAGIAEIDLFNMGDTVYLRTNPNLNYPLGPGAGTTYDIYLFEGNHVLNDGDLISSLGVPVVAPISITLIGNGHFGPTQIWASAVPGEYTVILDRTDTSGAGKWNIAVDFRDDLCTAIPTPPSFFVIPEVPFGTLSAIASFAFAFILRARKRT